MKINNDSEFTEAKACFHSGTSFKGCSGYALEKCLADYTSGADMIGPNNETSFFGKTKFEGKTASATIKKMDVSPRR